MKLAIHNEVAVSNDEVRQLDRAYVFHSWSMQDNLNPLVIAGAQGCELWDYEGNTWLDFSSQLVNVNIGYQHPRVLAAMKSQLETLVTIAPATANLARGEAAKRIVDLAPAGFSKVFFTNAGADANENAIRMARLYTGRDKVLSAYRSYHGNTGSAIAATGDWRRVPNEFSRGHVHFFNPYLYRSEFNAATEEEECQRALALLFLSRGVELAAVKVGVEEVNVAAGELIRHPAPVAGSGDRAAGVAMIGTIGRQHLVAPGIEPRHANRVLIGIRPGVSEEHLTEARRRQIDDALRRFAAGKVGGGGRDGDQGLQLRLHGRQYPGVLIANVDVHQLAAEIEPSVPLIIP